MEEKAKPDFSGYATKAGLKCSDGRIIMPDAFKHQDQTTVPLVWQHNHNEPTNVLGHAILEHREDGVYAYGFFNDSDTAKNARTLVTHGDIKSLSIYANQLTEKSKQVLHGFIRELSLVLSGANPGALIDNITIAHQDGDFVTLDDEAIIYTGLELNHESDPKTSDEPVEHAEDEEGPSVQEVYDSMTAEQKEVVHYMVGAALQDAVSHSDDDEVAHSDGGSAESTDDNEKDGRRMSRNVFEQKRGESEEKHVLTHDAIKGIVEDAQRVGSLKEAVEAYALQHGIDNIEVLFPDARNVTDTPEFDARRVEWVSGVINGTKHSPFSRIKSLVADITFEEARARGYIKGTLKKEEFFGVSKRVTTPTTVYKKQKLDRDDIIDITDFDVVTWLKSEMRLMMDEELARAILIGDGRDVADEDKIRDPVGASEGAGIRSILYDHDLYVATINVNVDDANSSKTEIVDAIISASQYYKGSGSPTLYTTLPMLTSILLERDQFGHRLWKTPAELASEMGVSSIVTVEVMEDEPDVVGIIVNLKDYTVGADKGGEINFFDDFDIDYNQYKYLLETRVSGALTKIRSALVVKKTGAASQLVAPVPPSFDKTAWTVTVSTTAGVSYKNKDTNALLATASPVSLAAGETLNVIAVPSSANFHFESNQKDEWTFKRPA
jgi:Caudovirus prohead serine protease